MQKLLGQKIAKLSSPPNCKTKILVGGREQEN
jgi:hypothetical protein